MRWRKPFKLPPSSSSPTHDDLFCRLPFLRFFLLALSWCLLCGSAGAKVDLAEPRLLDTVCPTRSFTDIQGEYIRYPVCLETRWVLGAVAAPSSSSTASGSQGSEDTIANADAYTASSLSTAAEGTATATTGSGSATGDNKPPETRTNTDIEADTEADSDSPLDNAHFLSFEEWKKLNLAKAGQSAENVGKNDRQGGPGAGGAAATVEDRKRRAQAQGINNALDALGEDSEIELEFGGFATENEDISAYERKGVPLSSDSVSSGEGEKHATSGTEGEVYADTVSRRGADRGKEAGTTCKERFNYASFDCAATVLKTNPQCTGSSSVLIENKDSYMLNECRAENKFLILELCDDIQVDTVVLANYEFFSSIFRTFRVSVTDRYPAKPDMWKELGTYEAANTREVQAFAVDNPLIWARYLRIEFLTHYGNEFYCPVSLVRVHGTTMMEDYKNDGDATRVEAEDETITERIVSENGGQAPSQEKIDTGANSDEPADANEQTNQSVGGQPAYDNVTEICQPQRAYVEKLLLGMAPMNACTFQGSPQADQNQPSALHQPQAEKPTYGSSATLTAPANVTSVEEALANEAASRNSTEPESGSQQPSHESRVTTSAGSQKSEDNTSTETYKPPTATQSQQQPPPPTPNPTNQESFFKSVNKRLQMLETNSSLSLLYIEEQSRILRDAFKKVEKRQLTKTSNFLENLNSTVLHELREFRQQYDHIWHSVIIDFEQQRQQYHRELYDVSAQLGILADELVFQKRIAIFQGIFVLICFGLVLFSRSSVGTYLEQLPRVQSFVSRPQSFRSASPSYETPSATPSPEEQHRSYQNSMTRHHHHQRQPSDDSRPESVSEPVIAYSAPTPPESFDIASTRSDGDEKVVYPHPGGSASSAVSNPMMLDPDSGLELRQRSSPPSLGRGDSEDSVASI